MGHGTFHGSTSLFAGLSVKIFTFRRCNCKDTVHLVPSKFLSNFSRHLINRLLVLVPPLFRYVNSLLGRRRLPWDVPWVNKPVCWTVSQNIYFSSLQLKGYSTFSA